MDEEEVLATEYRWADEILQEIIDAEQARASAEDLRRHRATVIAAKMPDFWNTVKFTAQEAAKRLGEQFHFESLPDDPNSFAIRRASAASLTGKVNGESISMICTRTDKGGQPLSDPPVRFSIHVDPNGRLYLKHLGESITVPDALKKMLRAAFVPR
jgi:hypothetical protein